MVLQISPSHSRETSSLANLLSNHVAVLAVASVPVSKLLQGEHVEVHALPHAELALLLGLVLFLLDTLKRQVTEDIGTCRWIALLKESQSGIVSDELRHHISTHEVLGFTGLLVVKDPPHPLYIETADDLGFFDTLNL